ncbi:BRCT domain-containing protein [Thermodesulfobacteriota bacterium]
MDTEDSLVKKLKILNDAYRRGAPRVSDAEYDRLVESLRTLNPNHPFLHAVEPEKLDLKREIRHPVPMLSMEKAYTREDLQRFINRVNKEAGQIGVSHNKFKMTPKLDGLAARDDGNIFATRGNGLVGYEISSAFQKGIIPFQGRGLGLGEVVVVKSYFDNHLADIFEHPRNMVVGIVTSDTLNESAKKAVQDNAVHFVPYARLPHWIGSADALFKSIDRTKEDLLSQIDYPVDGFIIEVTDERVQQHMGATAHHYRWQIAVKDKGETAVSTVKGINWQVGRAGNVTPVLEIQPISLSGATIRRVSAHHAGMVQKRHIGVGAEIEVIRSGEVIPKIERVIRETGQYDLPDKCPSCGNELEWDNDFLKCNNSHCRAQIEQRISHWFKTLGNADWFGIKTIQKLVDNGFDSLEKIYAMTEDDFLSAGFGPVQSKNLNDAIGISIAKRVEDWRFLAAFGIPDLGTGDSRKLLGHIKIDSFLQATAQNIEKIHGFGQKTSKSIEQGIQTLKETIRHMLSLGFNLEKSPLSKERQGSESAISGKGIVFSGKMHYGSRGDMQNHARNSGAKVQTAVSGATDYLVCGENVGAAKIEKAKKMGAIILTESEYFDLLASKHIAREQFE